MKSIRVLAFIMAALLLAAVSASGQDWVRSSLDDSATQGFIASTEADGSPVYIIRAAFGGGLAVGKYSPRLRGAYIPWGGKENQVSSFELFVGKGEWKPMKKGDKLPDGAIIGGSEGDGTPLYIIRGKVGSLLVPGKYNPNHQSAYVPWAGREENVNPFEILVRSSQVQASSSEWVATDVSDNASRAQAAGRSPDGTPSFLIRALFQGSLIPGKFNPKAKTAYVPWGGKENPVRTFELYIGPQLWFTSDPQTALPANAVPAGKEADGTPLYAIRSPSDTALVPGKYNPRTKEAYIPIGGKEVKVDRFEFLVSQTIAAPATVPVPVPVPVPAPQSAMVAPAMASSSSTSDVIQWLPSNPRFPPARSVAFATKGRTALFLIWGTLDGRPASGYLDPTTMQAFLLGEKGPVATNSYEVWGGGGWWAEVDAYGIPDSVLHIGISQNRRRIPLARVRNGSEILPAFYSEIDGTFIAYIGNRRTEFRKGEVLMPDWASMPTGVNEYVRVAVTERQGKTLVPYRKTNGDEWSVGKFVLGDNIGYISSAGNELGFGNLQGEIFIGTGVWTRPERAAAPDNAIPAGRDSTGAITYSIRASHMNDTALGQYNERLGLATIPYGGQEVRVTDFEVLCYPPLTAAPVSLYASSPMPSSPTPSGPSPSAALIWGKWPTTLTGLPFVRPSLSLARAIVPSAGFWSGSSDTARNLGVGDYGKVQVFSFEGMANETITLTLESGAATPGFYLIAPSGRWLYHEPMLDASAESYASGSYHAETTLSEAGTYYILVNHRNLDSFRLRFEGRSAAGSLDTKGLASVPFTAPEEGTYSFRAVSDGFSPLIQVVDAASKQVLASSFEVLDNGKLAIITVFLPAGRAVIVNITPVKGPIPPQRRYLLNARFEFHGAGS